MNYTTTKAVKDQQRAEVKRLVRAIIRALVDVLVMFVLVLSAMRGDVAWCVAIGSILIVQAVDRSARRQ